MKPEEKNAVNIHANTYKTKPWLANLYEEIFEMHTAERALTKFRNFELSFLLEAMPYALKKLRDHGKVYKAIESYIERSREGESQIEIIEIIEIVDGDELSGESTFLLFHGTQTKNAGPIAANGYLIPPRTSNLLYSSHS
jgi:hypothetical protein